MKATRNKALVKAASKSQKVAVYGITAADLERYMLEILVCRQLRTRNSRKDSLLKSI